MAGRISPAVALARLVLGGITPEQIRPLLPRGSPIAKLFASQESNLRNMARMLRVSGADHRDLAVGQGAAIEHMREMFDRAVAAAPEASVAAYSLGDPALLDAATEEVVRWLRERGLARAASDVLDLGCGIGRVAAALLPDVRSVVGLDVSPGMIAEARRRHASPDLRFDVTDGLPPAPLDDESLDLVIAVDSFPYLVQAGSADVHVADAVRMLRSGGALAILNLSYRAEADADVADALRWARQFSLLLTCRGDRPFHLWDGAAFVLHKH